MFLAVITLANVGASAMEGKLVDDRMDPVVTPIVIVASFIALTPVVNGHSAAEMAIKLLTGLSAA